MKVYFMRHGQTTWNKKGKIQGQVDVPLSEEGVRQAEATAEGMRDIPFDIIYASPLKRAYITAQIVRGDRDIPILRDDRLKEIAFGIAEGRYLSKEFAPGRKRIARYQLDPPNYRPPKYGESYDQVLKRTWDFYRTVILPLEGKVETVLVAAHGTMLRCFLCDLNGRDRKEMWHSPFGSTCSTALYEVKNAETTMVYENKVYY